MKKRNFKNLLIFFYNKFFPFVFVSLFLILSIILIYQHEFWQDETQAWLIGSESNSLAEFVSNMRDSQGHPYFWNAILYFVSHFITSNMESMKIVHLAISTTIAFLFLKYAPFNKIVRILFVFGYFPFYEYSIISRNYVLGILFIIFFCFLYKDKYKNVVPISIVLFLMGQTSLYAFVISIAFFLFLLFEFILDYKENKERLKKVYLIFLIIIVFAEILFVYWQLGSQATNNIWGVSFYSFFNKTIEEYGHSTIHVLKGIINAYMPIPYFNLHFFGSNIITGLFSNYNILYTIIISLIFLFIPIFIFKRRIIFLYILGIISILFVPYFIYPGSLRHWGHIFIFFFACLWISNTIESKNYLTRIKAKYINRLQNIFISIILISSLVGSGIAFYYEYKYPFSCGKQVSQYIKKNYDIDDVIVLGYKDAAVTTFPAYLDKEIYCPQIEYPKKIITFSVRAKPISSKDIIASVDYLIAKHDKILFVVSGIEEPGDEMFIKNVFKNINKDFNKSIVTSENFRLYLFDKEKILGDIDLIYCIDKFNFKDYFRPMNQCEFVREKDSVKIKVSGDDPWFETMFPFTFNKNKPIILIVNINTSVSGEFRIFLKRIGRPCIFEDSIPFNIKKGDSNIFMQISYSEDLEGLRIDPINSDNDCYIKRIEIYN